MSAGQLITFARDELHIHLDPSRPRSALLTQLYRLGMVEEAV